MHGTAHFKEPAACTEEEHREFARLVREGFAGSDDTLDDRIRGAHCLAFHYADDGALVGIAALKVPGARHREDIFVKADASVSAAHYELDLGWVFVAPAHRGTRIAGGLCEQLLARVPTSSVFATTRSNNSAMMRILLGLGFVRVGRPFPRRNEELALFLRSEPSLVGTGPAT